MPAAQRDVAADKLHLSALWRYCQQQHATVNQFTRLDKELFNASGFTLTACLCVSVYTESLLSHFCFLVCCFFCTSSFHSWQALVESLKSACVFLASAAHNSSSEAAASCSVMVLVYFRALSLVTFHSSLVLRSLAVGNVGIAVSEWLEKGARERLAVRKIRGCSYIRWKILQNCKKCPKKASLVFQDLWVLRSGSLRGAPEGSISTTYLNTLKSTVPVWIWNRRKCNFGFSLFFSSNCTVQLSFHNAEANWFSHLFQFMSYKQSFIPTFRITTTTGLQAEIWD